MNDLRNLSIILLDDPHGINEKAYKVILEFLISQNHYDIIDSVRCCENRYFLPENWDKD